MLIKNKKHVTFSGFEYCIGEMNKFPITAVVKTEISSWNVLRYDLNLIKA